MQSSRYSCQILMKLEFPRPGFEKYSNIKFHELQSSGRQVVLCGRTDRRTERNDKANNRFSQFCERVWNN